MAPGPPRGPMSGGIATRGLVRSFPGVEAVKGLDLDVREGEVYGFLGLNGAGKTTTLKMLTTLLRPTAGRAMVGGHDVLANVLEVRRAIGVLAELEAVTQPYWTPREYLRHFASLRGIPARIADHRIQALLQRIGMWEVADVPIGGFSNGMKRKVEVARALLHEPRVLFLDEPTRELDLPSKAEIWDMLEELVHQRRATVFLCSHDVGEVERLCDRVGILHQGKLALEAPLAALRASDVVRIHAPPGPAAAALHGFAGVRETWTEDGALLAALEKGTRRSDVLRALLAKGVEVEEFRSESHLGERLAHAMRHGRWAA
jgi:ABC-2 type transport system ATP-binding protein